MYCMNHLINIPFETFDLIDLKQLNISLEYSFNQIVRQHRGGVCCQMNGLFAFILKNLNYNVHLIPFNVYDHDKKHFHDRFSHVALYVKLDNKKSFLCDVGFTRNFLTPLYFRTNCIQYASNGFFRLTTTDDGLHYVLERGYLNEDEHISLPNALPTPQTHIIDTSSEQFKWTMSYRFPIDFLDKSTKMEDFEAICSFIVHSPEIILNHCTICCIHTYKPMNGIYGIIGNEYWQWIINNGIETREHYSITYNDNQLKKLLKEKFNLIIERKIQLVNSSI